jgi:hypothetical protein
MVKAEAGRKHLFLMAAESISSSLAAVLLNRESTSFSCPAICTSAW